MKSTINRDFDAFRIWRANTWIVPRGSLPIAGGYCRGADPAAGHRQAAWARPAPASFGPRSRKVEGSVFPGAVKPCDVSAGKGLSESEIPIASSNTDGRKALSWREDGKGNVARMGSAARGLPLSSFGLCPSLADSYLKTFFIWIHLNTGFSWMK